MSIWSKFPPLTSTLFRGANASCLKYGEGEERGGGDKLSLSLTSLGGRRAEQIQVKSPLPSSQTKAAAFRGIVNKHCCYTEVVFEYRKHTLLGNCKEVVGLWSCKTNQRWSWSKHCYKGWWFLGLTKQTNIHLQRGGL